MREQVAVGKFDHGESSAVVELTQAMHASLKDLMETDVALYFRLD